VKKPSSAELNGSPTDNNAPLFTQGYDSVLNPLYSSGKATKAADQSVPDWDNQQALTIFEQMLQKTGNNIDGVLAANDGLGNAAISALKQRKLKQIPVTGQDATAEGIQNILAGDQCMTVYKAIKKEADAASQLAIALANGNPGCGSVLCPSSIVHRPCSQTRARPQTRAHPWLFSVAPFGRMPPDSPPQPAGLCPLISAFWPLPSGLCLTASRFRTRSSRSAGRRGPGSAPGGRPG